jgi:hypothetical protein
MRAFAIWAGFAVAISLNAEAQTPPPLLAPPSPPIAKFTSGEQWIPAIEKYKKELYDRVYAQWLARVKAHDAELRVGTVRVRVTLTDTGRIRDLHILSTGASGRLKRLTPDAINHTDIAPPPLLTSQREISFDLTFRLLQH